MFILLLAMGYTCAIGTPSELEISAEHAFSAILGTATVLPLLYVSFIIIHWGYTNCTIGADVIRRLREKRRGYEIL